MSELQTFCTAMPVCPHCGHKFDHDNMMAQDGDLYALAPDEGMAEIKCPNAICEKSFWVQGGYIPYYTSAVSEDDL